MTVACGAGAIQLGFPVVTNDTEAGDQGHAQLADLGVGEMAHDGVLIGGAAGHGVLHELNDLRGEGGGHAGGENILGNGQSPFDYSDQAVEEIRAIKERMDNEK